MKKLSNTQQEVLAIIQKRGGGWFEAGTLPHWFHQRENTCRLLERKGYLERRYVLGALDPEFRLLDLESLSL